MYDFLESLHEISLRKYGFEPVPPRPDFNAEGQLYHFNHPAGHGYYWVYAFDNLYTVSIHDFELTDQFCVKMPVPEYLSLCYFESGFGEEFSPHHFIHCGTIRGFIGNSDVYRAVFRKDVPIRSISIELSPLFYENYLQDKYGSFYKDPRIALSAVDALDDFPELISIFKQIKHYKGLGLAAKFFYESKINEILGLITEKSEHFLAEPMPLPPSNQTMESLYPVISYINNHYAENIRLEYLAHLACMSPTKLKTSFKSCLNCSITGYIQSRRVQAAEKLLLTTDFSIQKIACEVGYKTPSRFSEIFCRQMGLLPKDYRKATGLSF